MCAYLGQDEIDIELIKVNELSNDFIDSLDDFNFSFSSQKSNPIIGIGDEARIITNNHEVLTIPFSWKNDDIKGFGTRTIYNLRVEGFENKNNDRTYNGKFGIFHNPYVEDILQSNRCIVPVKYFFEPNDSDKKLKYLIQKENTGTIFLGGVINNNGFSLLTTASSNITNKVGHKRSPLVISEQSIDKYLNPKTKGIELQTLFYPNNSIDFIAYRVNENMTKRKLSILEKLEMIKPHGDIIHV